MQKELALTAAYCGNVRNPRVGNVILINTTRLAPPMKISAIGQPDTLEEAINTSTTYQQLALSGFPVSYKAFGGRSNTIVLPAYTGSLSAKNLTAVTEEEEA